MLAISLNLQSRCCTLMCLFHFPACCKPPHLQSGVLSARTACSPSTGLPELSVLVAQRAAEKDRRISDTYCKKKKKKKHAHRQTFINTPVYSCIQACVRLRSSMPKRCACVWAQPDTCVTQMTPPLPGCVYVGCIPRCGWRVDHVVHGTRGYVGSIVLGWSRNAAPPFAWSERNGSPPPQHGLLEHLSYGGMGGGRARPTPLQAESGVICPTANTTINLSRPLPSARASTGRPGDASAATTSSRDKRRTARHKYCQRLADVWRTWWLPNNVCRGRTSGREEILLVPLLSFFRRFLWAHC